jgi:predicted acetyltransferase
MDFAIREPRAEEAAASQRLSHEAFGMPDGSQGIPAAGPGPGVRQIAAFDGRVMAGRLNDRDFDSWIGGRLVPTSGVGGVTVAMEYRGNGLLSPMFEQLFRIAKSRGAVISTLYPSATAIYRRFGYEVVGTRDVVRLPIEALGRGKAPLNVRVRRAAAGDGAAIDTIYDGWAAGHNGPLSRRGISFLPTEETLGRSTGVTVAELDGQVIGYVRWDRGTDSGAGAAIEVHELLATCAGGYQALMGAIGSFSGIAGHVSLQSSGLDLIRCMLGASTWQATASPPYMLKILDVPGALAARGYPAAVNASLEFGVQGDQYTANDGRYALQVADGRAACRRLGDVESGATGLPTFTPQGLALAFAGAQSCAGIRMVDGLSGPEDDDETWNAVFGGRPFRIRDRF